MNSSLKMLWWLTWDVAHTSAYGDLKTFLNAQLVDYGLVRLGLSSIVFVYQIILSSDSHITVYLTLIYILQFTWLLFIQFLTIYTIHSITVYMTAHKNSTELSVGLLTCLIWMYWDLLSFSLVVIFKICSHDIIFPGMLFPISKLKVKALIWTCLSIIMSVSFYALSERKFRRTIFICRGGECICRLWRMG